MTIIIYKRYAIGFLQLITMFIIGLIGVSCSDKDNVAKNIEITLAAEMSLLPATVWVAESKGYFKRHGINLTIKEFDSGRNALESMLKDDSIDISTVAQTPVVFNSFNKEEYVIIATMAYSLDDMKLLARKDHGINKPKDLVGKKVVATLRSTGHYFLDGFLAHYGYTLKNIKLHDFNAASLKGKLESGEMDAITSWEPHIYNTEKKMGKENLTKLISPTPFRKDFYFTVSKDYSDENSYEVKQFLKAVIDGENFIKSNPAEAKEVIAKRLNISMDLVKTIWPVFTFEISLDQSILVNLEDEAIWASQLSKQLRKIPNYLNFIELKHLLEVKPENVTLIH